MSLGTEEPHPGEIIASATVFQIIVNVPPVRRLICEWPRGSPDEGARIISHSWPISISDIINIKIINNIFNKVIKCIINIK